jgi:hypothetical protein
MESWEYESETCELEQGLLRQRAQRSEHRERRERKRKDNAETQRALRFAEEEIGEEF